MSQPVIPKAIMISLSGLKKGIVFLKLLRPVLNRPITR